jgi:hypothetical protein
MVVSRRHGLVFAAGVLFGIVAGASLVMVAHGPDSAAMKAAVAQPRQAVAAPRAPDCGFDPLLVAANARDGKFFLDMPQVEAAPSDVAAYILVGDAAASQGRLRDAELAYITSCRIATRVAGGESAELADAKYALARHYVTAASAVKTPETQAAREEALKRAEALFSESIDGYGMKFGVAHEKTRLAAAGLASLKEATAPVELAGPAPGAMPRELLDAKVKDYETVRTDPLVQAALAVKRPRPKPVVEDAPAEEPAPAAVARSEAPRDEPASTRVMGAAAGSPAAGAESGGP